MATGFPSPSTGSTFSFTRTREQLAVQVLEKLRVTGEGETPLDEDKARVYNAIDMRLKELHALGTLWFNVNGVATELALSVGVNTITLPLYVLFLVSASITESTLDDCNIEIVSHANYHGIEDINCKGKPTKIFVFNGIGYLWPVPDKAYILNITYEQIAADTQASTQPNVEVSMLRALKNMVCYDLADTYSVPEQRILRLQQEASDAANVIKLLKNPRTTRPRAKFCNY